MGVSMYFVFTRRQQAQPKLGYSYPNVTLTSHVFPSHVEHLHFVVGVVEDLIEPHCSFLGACNNLSRDHLSYGNWKVVKNEAINKTSM